MNKEFALEWTGTRSIFYPDKEVQRTKVHFVAKDSIALDAQVTDDLCKIYPASERSALESKIRKLANTIENGTVLGGGLSVIFTYVNEERSGGVSYELENRT